MRYVNETNAKGVAISLSLTERSGMSAHPQNCELRRSLFEHPKLKTHVQRLGIGVDARKISGQSEIYSFHIHVHRVDVLHLHGLVEIPLPGRYAESLSLAQWVSTKHNC